jgi:hypothetical protein
VVVEVGQVALQVYLEALGAVEVVYPLLEVLPLLLVKVMQVVLAVVVLGVWVGVLVVLHPQVLLVLEGKEVQVGLVLHPQYQVLP